MKTPETSGDPDSIEELRRRVYLLEQEMKHTITDELDLVKTRLDTLEDTERQKNISEISGLRSDVRKLGRALEDTAITAEGQ